VEIEPDEIKAIHLESTHTLDIDKFVPADEIDRRYLDRTYYIVLDGKAGEEAFAVIRDAMGDKGRLARAHIVFTDREHVMAIEPFGKIMLGTIQIPEGMVSLASRILDTKAGHFDPSAFEDAFEEQLRKLVKQPARPSR
jgi:DNA end-binding protein Ku